MTKYKSLFITIYFLSTAMFLGCATPYEQMREAMQNNDVNQAEKALNAGVTTDEYFLDAVKNRNYTIVQMLLAKGANVNKSEGYVLDGDVITYNKTSPYSITDTNNIKTPIYIKRYKYRVKENGRNGLHYAIFNHDSEMVKILLAAGATPDIEYPIEDIKIYPEYPKNYRERLFADGFHIILPFALSGESYYFYVFDSNGRVGQSYGRLEYLTDSAVDNLFSIGSAIVVLNGVVDSAVSPISPKMTTPIKYAQSLGLDEIVQLLRKACQQPCSEN